MKSSQANRLSRETSPYLLQHAYNPVDWYPWGEEALMKADREKKPILLSIGYSACHWCHVMAHESFEDESIAQIMNDHFVNIKVDREERPDLDKIYQTAVQIFLRRGGGWPLTMFLTPGQVPFYGGTYFPPEDRYGIPSFGRVLRGIVQVFREKPEDIQETVRQIREAMAGISREASPAAQTPVDPQIVSAGVRALYSHFDQTHGGFGTAPKFPATMSLNLFLRHYQKSRETRYLEAVDLTLRKMARGGIYDQLGGGFHRYSTDVEWLAPHFEKMLYDNAQLVMLYLSVYQVTGDPFHATIAQETLDYVLREMTHSDGGFYATQDADSERVEGKFFTWSQPEIRSVLGDDAEPFCRYYDVTPAGNWEHRNILRVVGSLDDLSAQFDMPREALRDLLARGRTKLFSEREKRIKPHRDEKVLASWNGLMIQAFAQGAMVLGNTAYLRAANSAADFIFQHLYHDGRLRRTWKDGEGKLNAYLDDYAFVANALLELHQVDFEPRHLDRARSLINTLNEQFWDSNTGGYFFTSRDHEALMTRMKSGIDESIPSGNALAAQALLTFHHLTGDPGSLERAERILRLYAPAMQENPFGHGGLLNVADFYLEKPKEIVLVEGTSPPETRAFLQEIRRIYLPNRIFFLSSGRPGDLPEPLRGKVSVGGRPTLYVCSHFTCSAPVTTIEEARALLGPSL